jgi:hypothetical protein
MGPVTHQRRNPGPILSTEVFCFTKQIFYKPFYFNNIEYGKNLALSRLKAYLGYLYIW